MPQPSTNELITSPRTVLLPARMDKPFPPPDTRLPLSSMTGESVKPGCVVPSMISASVTKGSGESGLMACAPEPMLKAITSGPGRAFASRIAWRSEPGPLSAVLVTTKVAVWASRGHASMMTPNRRRILFMIEVRVNIYHNLSIQASQSRLNEIVAFVGRRANHGCAFLLPNLDWRVKLMSMPAANTSESAAPVPRDHFPRMLVLRQKFPVSPPL